MKIGLAVNNLGASHLNLLLIKSANQLAASGQADTCFLFEQLSAVPIRPHCAVMQFVDAYSFNGIGLATNLSTAQKLVALPALKKRYFYIWDLEWLRIGKDFWKLRSVYSHPELSLLTRSKEHAKLISDLYGKESVVIGDLTAEKLLEICRD